MKKIYLCFLLLFIFMSGSAMNTFALEQPSLPSNIDLEIAKNSVELPPLKLRGDYSYTIDLFDNNDNDYLNPIAKNISEYKFDRLISYKLRYNLIKNDNNQSFKLFTTIKLVDTTKPTIDMLKDYNKKYAQYEEIKLFQATVNDNFDSEISYSVSVKCNNKDITKDIKNNKIKLKDSGFYSITYSASDKAGNSNEYHCNFEVGKKNFIAIIIILSSIGIVLIGTVALIVVKNKKRREKNDK